VKDGRVAGRHHREDSKPVLLENKLLASTLLWLAKAVESIPELAGGGKESPQSSCVENACKESGDVLDIYN
jgi:hypothetical protein